MAMRALKIGAPKDHMRVLQEHADTVNLPRVGVDENVAFLAVQANIAPAVALEDAGGIQNINWSYIYLNLFQLRVSNRWVLLGWLRVTQMKAMTRAD